MPCHRALPGLMEWAGLNIRYQIHHAPNTGATASLSNIHSTTDKIKDIREQHSKYFCGNSQPTLVKRISGAGCLEIEGVRRFRVGASNTGNQDAVVAKPCHGAANSLARREVI